MNAKRVNGLKTALSVSFLIMIVVNVLAEALPLGGRTTEQVSDSHPNLFSPAGYTFAIWGLIYLLGALHVLYQLGIFRSRRAEADEKLLARIAVPFSISSLANAAWIFFWHYDQIAFSMAMMLVILFSLALILVMLRKKTLSKREKLLVKLPFSVYFGWITVATIANAATLLVSLGWDRWGLSDGFWTAVMLIAGLLIGAAWILRARDMAYGLVLVWAYTGIMVKHFTSLSGAHPVVIAVTAVCIAAFIALIGYVGFFERRRLKAAHDGKA
jgi:hypothetical protein